MYITAEYTFVRAETMVDEDDDNNDDLLLFNATTWDAKSVECVTHAFLCEVIIHR